MAQHNDLGKKGEQLAVDYLIKKDYQILERNYRFQKAEVDIIEYQRFFTLFRITKSIEICLLRLLTLL